MKKLFVLVLTIALFGTYAQNDRNGDFKKWDADGDGTINSEEFNSSWDDNDFYGTWDEDGDGSLNENEWQQGVDTYYSNIDGWKKSKNRNFSTWDRNRNGTLDENEFRQGSYSTWDANGNNNIDENEYNNYYTLGDGRGMK